MKAALSKARSASSCSLPLFASKLVMTDEDVSDVSNDRSPCATIVFNQVKMHEPRRHSHVVIDINHVLMRCKFCFRPFRRQWNGFEQPDQMCDKLGGDVYCV